LNSLDTFYFADFSVFSPEEIVKKKRRLFSAYKPTFAVSANHSQAWKTNGECL